MLSDGSNTFSWNARDEVAVLNGVSLQYDAAGRRIKNTAGKPFLYDGVNAAQELSGTTPTANMWTGGTDELFQRTDGNGTLVPITDALGSVLGLVDASGNLTTQYSYDAFGNTTTSGVSSSNPSQYTGRENEGKGLYFYRARYYSPVLGRFINEDPLGFGGGDANFYAYVGDDPVNAIDPSGLKRDCLKYPRLCFHPHPPPKLSGRKEFAEFVGQLLGLLGAQCIRPDGCEDGTFGLGPRSRPHAIGANCVSYQDGPPCPTIGLLMPVGFGHGARHLVGTGLAEAEVNEAIAADVNATVGGASSVGSFWGRVVVNGQTIEYRAFPVPDRSINVGTYYPK